MPSDKPQAVGASFADAIKVQKLDANTYKAELSPNFTSGAVAHGGYVASCILAAAGQHLADRNQPHSLTAHFEYPGRSSVGPCVIIIEDVKLGRQISTLHATLWQGALLDKAPWITPSHSRRCVLAYTSQANLQTFSGISMPTGFESTLVPLRVPDFKALKGPEARDEHWEEVKTPKGVGAVDSLRNLRHYQPRRGPLAPGVMDIWMCLASGEPITQHTLPFLVDSFPHNMHTFLISPELRALLEGPPPESSNDSEDKTQAQREIKEKDKQRAAMWMPTVVMNLETKAVLPEEGVEWLHMCVTCKQMKDGRFDMDILVRDVDGELVALSHHVALVVTIERNRGKKPGKASL